MTEIIILLSLFGIKHFICDFLLQFPYMIAQKGIYGAEGGIHHATIHGVCTWVILLPFLGSMAVFPALFDMAAHYHIDWAKQQLNKGLTTADRMFWVWFGADQGLHYLTYVAIIGWTVGAF
jgi:Protein of unknown function (DUF3307)